MTFLALFTLFRNWLVGRDTGLTKCPSCHGRVEPGDNFCGLCGLNLINR